MNDGKDAGPARPMHALAELLGNPACVLDGAGNIRYLNRAWRTFGGVAGAGSTPREWSRLLCPEDRVKVTSQIRLLDRAVACSDIECRLVGAGGDLRWFQLSLQPVSDGSDDAWLCTSADIHRFKSCDADRDGRSRQAFDLFGISDDCINHISPSGHLIAMNKAGRRSLGIAEDAVSGLEWLQLLPRHARSSGEEALAAACNGISSRFTGYGEQSGQVRVWDNALTPIRASDGSIASIICVSREITAERAAQDALRQSQERLVLASRVGGLGIWDYDIENDVLYCDDTWYRIVDADPLQPVRCVADVRRYIHPDDVERATEVHATVAELIAQDRDYATVFRIVRPNGEIRWVRSAACLIKDLAGVAKRAIGFIVDITETLRNEAALRNVGRCPPRERHVAEPLHRA